MSVREMAVEAARTARAMRELYAGPDRRAPGRDHSLDAIFQQQRAELLRRVKEDARALRAVREQALVDAANSLLGGAVSKVSTWRQAADRLGPRATKMIMESFK